MLADLWAQLWPNLLANALWVPVAALHHVRLKRHLTSLHRKAKGE